MAKFSSIRLIAFVAVFTFSSKIYARTVTIFTKGEESPVFVFSDSDLKLQSLEFLRAVEACGYNEVAVKDFELLSNAEVTCDEEEVYVDFESINDLVISIPFELSSHQANLQEEDDRPPRA